MKLSCDQNPVVETLPEYLTSEPLVVRFVGVTYIQTWGMTQYVFHRGVQTLNHLKPSQMKDICFLKLDYLKKITSIFFPIFIFLKLSISLLKLA